MRRLVHLSLAATTTSAGSLWLAAVATAPVRLVAATARAVTAGRTRKSALKQFYLLVHPDLFSQYPEAKVCWRCVAYGLCHDVQADNGGSMLYQKANEASIKTLLSLADLFETQEQPSSFGAIATGMLW
jgi:hypothetical protein